MTDEKKKDKKEKKDGKDAKKIDDEQLKDVAGGSRGVGHIELGHDRIEIAGAKGLTVTDDLLIEGDETISLG